MMNMEKEQARFGGSVFLFADRVENAWVGVISLAHHIFKEDF